MLGAASVPFETPADLVMRRVAERMGVADTYHQPEVAVFFGEPGREVDDPYFGGDGPRRTGLHPLRRLHGRLPARGQEHARPQLPPPRRAARRGRPPGARGDAPDARRRRLGGAGGAAGTAARRARALPRGPGRARGGRARHRLAAPALRARRPARGRARAHELRGDRRRDRGHREGRLLDRCRDHLVDPPRSRRRTSSRCATRAARTRWACSATVLVDGGARDAAPAPLPRPGRAPSARVPAQPLGAALVGADDHPARDAVARQRAAAAPAARPAGQLAGRRRAESELHPGRERGGSPHRRGDRRPAGQLAQRGAARRADDGAHPRRRLHRRLARDGGGRRVPPRVLRSGPARRGRLRREREPRRQPVADDHRAGRARARPLARTRASPTSGRRCEAGRSSSRSSWPPRPARPRRTARTRSPSRRSTAAPATRRRSPRGSRPTLVYVNGALAAAMADRCRGRQPPSTGRRLRSRRRARPCLLVPARRGRRGASWPRATRPAFPSFAWPEPGDRVQTLGSWVWNCTKWKPAGERTELHPFRALWVQRAVSRAQPVGRERRATSSSRRTRRRRARSRTARCRRRATDGVRRVPGDRAALAGRHAATTASCCPRRRSRPDAGRLYVRVVDQGSVGAAPPNVTLENGAAVVTMKLASAPGRSASSSRSRSSSAGRRCPRPSSPSTCGSRSAARLDARRSCDAAGAWGPCSARRTIDVYLPRGTPWRLAVYAPARDDHTPVRLAGRLARASTGTGRRPTR